MTKLQILALIKALAQQHHLDPALVASVVEVESQFRPDAHSETDDRGLMQLNNRYFPGDEWYEPTKNLEAGVAHLVNARKRCSHQLDFSYVLCYHLGISGASRIQNPKLHPYLKKITEVYPAYAASFAKASRTATPETLQLCAQR